MLCRYFAGQVIPTDVALQKLLDEAAYHKTMWINSGLEFVSYRDAIAEFLGTPESATTWRLLDEARSMRAELAVYKRKFGDIQ